MSQDRTAKESALEQDFRQVYDPAAPSRFIPGTSIEVIREPVNRGNYRHVLFDFDGTLSLIREGWSQVMVPMMVEILRETGTDEDPDDLYQMVMSFVMRLTGKQTLYQMVQLREEVIKRAGRPLDPVQYKQMYHERLMKHIASRRDDLASGRAAPEDYLVPGSVDILRNLCSLGLTCYLASGTDEQYVVEEAELLDIVQYFSGGIFGAKADIKDFSKAMVIQGIFQENQVDGRRLLGFGDGYVEIDNIRSAGGTPVAVASDEANRSGKPDPWKRNRLVGTGAEIVIPDFREQQTLVAYLMDAAWRPAH
jgi:phosphoglycolate phosphatase-like HAD superfamily hydrolase